MYSCRTVDDFQCLKKIGEGSYGIVYRARDRQSEEIVALKRLKLEDDEMGFPITSLREFSILFKLNHQNIVAIKEVVISSNMCETFVVMDYVENDMRQFMESMKQKKQSFLQAEVKCLMQQLLQALVYLHDNWILHRDLKVSNLLLSDQGILKVCDFGLSREYGSPIKIYTPKVVTLWYRAPELLIEAREYSTTIDIWSVGCIFGEFLKMEPIFAGESEIEQLKKICKALGIPDDKMLNYTCITDGQLHASYLNSQFPLLSYSGCDLLSKLLMYNPEKRITAEKALEHDYFKKTPLAVEPEILPLWLGK